MAKDKEDDVEKWLKENLPDYEKTLEALPSMEVKEEKEKRPTVSFEDRLLFDLLGGLAGERIAGGSQKVLEKTLERQAQRAAGAPGPASILGAGPRATPPAAQAMPQAIPQGVPQAPDLQREARILRGTPGEMDISGRARQTGYAVQTAQDAAAQRQMQQIIEQMRQRGVVGSTAQQLLANAPGMTSTEHGILAPRSEPRPTVGPRAVEPPMGPPVPPTSVGYTQAPPRQPGALQRMGQAIGSGARTAGGVAADVLSAPRLAGAAGGVGAMEAYMDYQNRIERDPLGAYLAAAMGAVSASSAFPLLPTPHRIGTAVAPPLVMMAYDKLRPYKSVLEQPKQ